MNFKNPSLKWGLLSLFLFSGITSYAQQQFTFNGQLPKGLAGKLYLEYWEAGNQYIDSATVADGKFSFKGSIKEPQYATLTLKPSADENTWQRKDMFIEPASITLSGGSNLYTSTVKGGPSQADFVTLIKNYDVLVTEAAEVDSLVAKYKTEGNDDKLKETYNRMTAMREKRRDIQKEFIRSHRDSYVSFSLWMRDKNGFIDPAVIEPEFMSFTPRIRNTLEGRQLADQIAKAKTLLPGNKAPDFSLQDINGKSVSLSSLKGKNVLVCFWAKNFIGFEQLPFAINKISRQFKDENLALMLVYFEANPGDDWKSIVSESALTSPNIINVTDPGKLGSYKDRLGSPVRTAYDLHFGTMPLCYLISPDGVILARDINLEKDPVAAIKQLIVK